MSSVDELLRQALASSDREWVGRAPSALREVYARHRRVRVVRGGVAGLAAAAALVVAATVAGKNAETRTVEPAESTPTQTPTTPTGATALEGTWISAPLRAADVRTAARLAGAPAAAEQMLDDLPDPPFRVVVVVRGSSVRALARSPRSEDALLDEEVISTSGTEVELRTLFGDPGTSVHGWTVKGDRLRMTFQSTTERSQDGVPGEAWHRLLYDSATFTR